MIDSLERDNVLGFISIEELVQRKLMVPTAHIAPQDLSAYKDPLGIWGNLVEG